MVSKLIRLVLLFFICSTAIAQAQSVDSDAFIKMTTDKLQFQEGFNLDQIRFPWLEEVQIRTETRDMDFEQQEYTLRISPSSRKKIRAQKALFSHYRSLPNTDQSKANEQTLRTIYADWLTLFFIDREREILDSLELIWTDKKKVNDKLLSSYEIDVKDMIGLEIKKNNLSLSQFELEMEKSRLAEIYDLQEETLDHSKMISIELIEKKLSEMIMLGNSVAKIDSELDYQYEKEGIQKEIQLEKAEEKQYFDFGQVRYRGPHAEVWEEKVSFGLGVKFPSSGNRKLKLAELAMDLQALEAEHAMDKAENDLKVGEVVEELKSKLALARHYNEVIAKEKKELAKLAKIVQQQQGYNPLILLDVKENLLSRRAMKLKYEQEIYIDYIKLLSMLGKLSESPFVNYLKA